MTRAPNLPLTCRETGWLQHIATHGPLASDSLLAQCAHTHRCKVTGLRTLQKLREGGYLHRPKQQEAMAKADFNPDVYDLTRAGQAMVTGPGAHRLRPTGHWWHRFFVASFTSAIAIEARSQGIGFLSAADILGPDANSLAIPLPTGGRLIPDQLFALRFPQGFRLVAFEVDRGTEPLASNAARKSVASMIRSYVFVQRQGLHKVTYGVRSPLLLLVIFSHPTRTSWFLDALSDQSDAQHAGIFAQTYPQPFPRINSVNQMLRRPVLRAGLPPFCLWSDNSR